MRSRLSRRVLLCAGCFAAALLALRLYTLLGALGPEGLLPRDSLLPQITAGLCVCCFAVLCVLCLKLDSRPGSYACFSWNGVFLFCRLLAGLFLALGCLFSLIRGRAEPDTIQTVYLSVGLFCGLGMILITLTRSVAAGFWTQALLTVFAVAGMVLRFRTWSHEPLVIDILPSLLALICDMVGVMLIAGFALRVGHRRSTVLFGLCAGIFTLMALPDFFAQRTPVGEALIYLGLGLWCAAHGLTVLKAAGRTPKRAEEPSGPAPAESAPGEAAPQGETPEEELPGEEIPE